MTLEAVYNIGYLKGSVIFNFEGLIYRKYDTFIDWSDSIKPSHPFKDCLHGFIFIAPGDGTGLEEAAPTGRPSVATKPKWQLMRRTPTHSLSPAQSVAHLPFFSFHSFSISFSEYANSMARFFSCPCSPCTSVTCFATSPKDLTLEPNCGIVAQSSLI